MPKNLPYNPSLKPLARSLSKNSTLSEVLLWLKLKNRNIKDLDFDRQRIIGDYIVDFYCPSIGLVIEIDGSSHLFKYEDDIKREEYLVSLGLKVLRFDDLDVKQNMEGVLGRIKDVVEEMNVSTTPSATRPPLQS